MKKSSKKYFSWDLAPIIAESKRLEMELLLLESNKVFRMMKQAEETRPEDTDSKKEESE